MRKQYTVFAFIISLCLNLLITNLTKAQTFTLYGDKMYGGNASEECITTPILKTGNNQFILSGSSFSNVSGDKTQPLCADTPLYANSDIWIVKADANFNILWNKGFGGSRREDFASIQLGANGNILFACQSLSDSSCEKTEHNRSLPNISSDYWICMLDSNGNKLWDKTLGGSKDEFAPQIIHLNSGNIIVAGGSRSPADGDKTVANFGVAGSVIPMDYWVVKLDSMGNKLWDNVYGGTGSEEVTGSLGTSLSVFKDGAEDFILAGSTLSVLSGSISDTSRGGLDIWLIKLDSAGNTIWDKRYGGTGYDHCAHITHTTDNGYMVLGSTNSPQGLDVSDTSRGVFTDLWVIKLDSLGNKQWDKRYGGNAWDFAAWIEPAPGGGYWVSGSTRSDSSGEVSEPNYGIGGIVGPPQIDYWIIKIDSAGNKLWDKRFGGDGTDRNSSFVITADSSIFMFGIGDTGTSAVKTDAGNGNSDYWLVHFKYDDYSTGINAIANQNNLITVYPNPANDILSVQGLGNQNNTIKITNQMGQLLFEKRNLVTNDFKIDVKDFSQGVYFLEVQSEKARKVSKFVKM